jgi:endonuclease/exonuclease/phosphatase family metal-dependent hydrolase
MRGGSSRTEGKRDAPCILDRRSGRGTVRIHRPLSALAALAFSCLASCVADPSDPLAGGAESWRVSNPPGASGIGPGGRSSPALPDILHASPRGEWTAYVDRGGIIEAIVPAAADVALGGEATVVVHVRATGPDPLEGAQVCIDSAAPDGIGGPTRCEALDPLLPDETTSVSQIRGPLAMVGAWIFRATLRNAAGEVLDDGPREGAVVSVWPVLRVMTYNIQYGGPLGVNLGAVADAIRAEDPDLVGLNEVDHQRTRSGFRAEAEELAAATGLPYQYYGCTIGCGDVLPGRYGLAILSRFELTDWTKEFLPNRADGAVDLDGDPEARALLCGRVLPPGTRTTVRFCVTHFTNGSTDDAFAVRALQAQRVLELLGPDLDGDGRVILVGDLNEVPGSGAVSALLARFGDAWSEAGDGTAGATIPSDAPAVRFDYVLRGPAFGPATFAFVPETTASDHRPVSAWLLRR